LDSNYASSLINILGRVENLLIEQQSPFFKLKPKLYRNGSQWCVLYGDNIMENLCGFGNTPNEAAIDFKKNGGMYTRAPEGSREWMDYWQLHEDR